MAASASYHPIPFGLGGSSSKSPRPKSPPRYLRLHIRLVAAVFAFLLLSFMLFPQRAYHLPNAGTKKFSDDSSYNTLPDEPEAAEAEDEYIPNVAHFVCALEDPEGQFNFQFKHYLSIYAAWRYWRPDKIYLHTNANSSAIERARNGTSGRWDDKIFNLPNLEVRYADAPARAENGAEIQGPEHRSDFMRVEAVQELGGVYLDWDAHALRDVRVLRESGFRAVGGRQLGGQVISGTFMAVAGARLLSLWRDGMHRAYDGGWTTHSNEVITRFAERLVGQQPGEMLILDRHAFTSGSWEQEDLEALYGVHDEAVSNLHNITQGELLPEYDEGFADRWDRPEEFPDWATDWSRSYVMHAFNPERFGNIVEGFEAITPRYVLERKSNFARAVYPIARDLYHKGLIRIEDSHLGF